MKENLSKILESFDLGEENETVFSGFTAKGNIMTDSTVLTGAIPTELCDAVQSVSELPITLCRIVFCVQTIF